jgi:hypothetical protein
MARILAGSKVRAVEKGSDRLNSMDERSASPADSDPRLELGVQIRLVDRFALVRLSRPEAPDQVDLAEILRPPLSRLLEEGQVRQVLDLDGLDCASAPLVTFLACHHRRLRKREGILRLHGVGTRLSAALGCCGLLGMLELYQDLEDALRGENRLDIRA